MSASGFTPISLYYSTTASAVPTAANLVPGELAINTNDGKLYYEDSAGVVQVLASKAGALGDVVGPASATDNALARFDLTTGKLIQNSIGILTDAGVLSGLTGLTSSGPITLSSLTSGRVTYATTAGLLTDSANLLYSGTDLTVYGLTVGRGGGAVSTNTAIGASALSSNSSGTRNTVVGSTAGSGITGSRNTVLGDNILAGSTSGNDNVAIGDYTMRAYTGSNSTAVGAQAMANGSANTGDNNTAIGSGSLNANASGASNTAVGASALQANTTASNNTAVGYQAGYLNQTGNYNVFIGQGAGYNSNFSGSAINTFVGTQAGYYITSGIKNTIIGNYSGNFGGLDIRTGSNYIVLSDGDGNPLISTNSTSSVALNGAVPQTGTGITFPATQSASSNANTLDDYEEGTFTVTFTPSTSGTITLSGSYNTATYTKVGRLVTVTGEILVASASAPVGTSVIIGGLPFVSGSGASFSTGFAVLDLATQTLKSARLSTTNSTVDLFVNASTIGTNSNFILGFSYIV